MSPDHSLPKSWWLGLTFWFFFSLEVICLLFVVLYWNDLQASLEIQKDEVVMIALFGSPLVLGFLRAFILCSLPLITYGLFSVGTRILFSKTLKLGDFEVESLTENLTQTERDYEKFKDYSDKTALLYRTLLEQVIESAKQKGVKK